MQRCLQVYKTGATGNVRKAENDVSIENYISLIALKGRKRLAASEALKARRKRRFVSCDEKFWELKILGISEFDLLKRFFDQSTIFAFIYQVTVERPEQQFFRPPVA